MKPSARLQARVLGNKSDPYAEYDRAELYGEDEIGADEPAGASTLVTSR